MKDVCIISRASSLFILFFSREKKDSLDGEIFDMLYTLSDFVAFKEMFLDYKNFKEGRTIDLSSSISVISYQHQLMDDLNEADFEM